MKKFLFALLLMACLVPFARATNRVVVLNGRAVVVQQQPNVFFLNRFGSQVIVNNGFNRAVIVNQGRNVFIQRRPTVVIRRGLLGRQRVIVR